MWVTKKVKTLKLALDTGRSSFYEKLRTDLNRQTAGLTAQIGACQRQWLRAQPTYITYESAVGYAYTDKSRVGVEKGVKRNGTSE